MAEYKVNYTQSNFTGGIIAAELYGRNDFNKVKSGLKQCVNWTIREAGGLEFRRGTKYLATIPVSAGVNFKTASLGEELFVFGDDGIYWLKDKVSFEKLEYPVSPKDLSKLQFTELQRRLYFYDGEIKLSQITLDDEGTPQVAITKFEGELPSETSVETVVVPKKWPSSDVPTVQIDYQYAISVAKDEEHESLALIADVVQANAELGSGEDGESQRIDLTIKLTPDTVSAAQDGKVFIYRKYQGKYYYLDSVFLKDFESPTEEEPMYKYVYSDKGQFSPDVSRAIKEKPEYLESDGSVIGVNSIADYGQRIFMTIQGLGTNIIFSQVGNTDSLAYSELRNEDEAGYLEVPISHFDDWCKVVAGLDLIFSTSYTISQIQGYGDLQLQTVLFDGFSKTVQPVTTRRSLIYTNSNNRNIYDLTYNEYGQYDGIDLTLLVKYIFETKTIKRLAFKDYPVKTIYVLCDDGDLYCLTYIKDQNIYAWYKIEHYDKIHDLLVVNKDTEDDIYIVVQTGESFIIEQAYNRTDSIYMDSCVLIERKDIVDNKITGLPAHMVGKKVRVFDLGNNLYYGDYDIRNPKSITQGGNVVQIDDLDFDGYEVSEDGSIQLEDYIEITGNVYVGLPYYAVAETIPLEFSDSNGNSTIGRQKTINEAYLRYGDSRGLTYKTLGKEYDCGIAKKDVADNAEFLERGQVRLDVASEYKWDSTIKILQRQPYPARIESITLGLHFNDKS